MNVLRRRRKDPIVNTKNNIVAVLYGPDGRVKERHTFYGKNLVTNVGDQYYAEAIVASGSVITPAGMRVGSSAVAPTKTDTSVGSVVASGSVATDSGYPRTADNDADNTGGGADIVTWRFSFGTAAANANGIQEVAIVDSLTSPTAALMRGTVASFNKTSSDTLKVFVNHTINGV